MKVNYLGRKEFLDRVYTHREAFLEQIHAPEIFVVRQFYPSERILELRNRVFQSGLQSEPSWHPLLDDCPDYHRLHDNYPKAYVKAKMHAFYFHGWYEHNHALFDEFSEIFDIKCFLGGFAKGSFLRAKPSAGVVSRVNLQNYPVGGGYLAEHIDPNSNFALVQTLVQGSRTGTDFEQGGLYARRDFNSEKLYLDPLTEPGDLMVLSPAIPHGVAPVDPDKDYAWRENAGKWTILPIIVASDYPSTEHKKPREVEPAAR